MLRSLLAPSLALLATCASNPAPRAGGLAADAPARVEFRHLERGQSMALVNQAHTDRVELYSQQRRDWSTKVAENEVMDLLIEYLDGPGRFFAYARPGPGPASGYQKYGEAQLPSGTYHWAIHANSPLEEKRAFLEWQTNFLALWDSVAQLQAVDGPFDFSQPRTERPRRAGRD